MVDTNNILLSQVAASRVGVPKSSKLVKIFLDTDGILKKVDFAGKITPLANTDKQIVASFATIEQLNQVLYPLFETLVELISVEGEMIAEDAAKATSSLQEAIEKVIATKADITTINTLQEEIKATIEEYRGELSSWRESQELANGIVAGDIADIEDKVSKIDDAVKSKAEEAVILKLITNINNTLLLKANKSDIPDIVAKSDNVTITKNGNTYGIAVDIQEKVIETIIRENTTGNNKVVAGGISKNAVQKMIDAAVANISGGGGGGGTVTDITSVDGSVVVSPIVGGYDLSVTDRFVNVTGDTMTGTLSMSGVGIQLDTNHTPAWVEGKVFYDAQQHTLAYYNDNNEVTVNVGAEQLVRVRNTTGSTINNGQVVCISGSSGSHPLVVLATNADPTIAHRTLGIATHHLGNNENGYITTSGLVNGLDTTSFSAEGVVLWLGTGGNITETEPTAPTHKVKLGYLVRKHATQGSILVSIDTGLDIGNLHDVKLNTLSNGDILRYSSLNSRWENAPYSGGGTASVSGGTYQGLEACDTSNIKYTIAHPSIDTNYSFPTASLVIPSSGSNIFVHGITNRSSTSFDVTLSEVPSATGYYISWHLPISDASLNGVPVVNVALSNIPSYTTTISGSYSVSLSQSVVYADNANTIVLPASPTTDESHWIVNTYTADITIDGNGKNISVDGINNATLSLPPDSSLHIHYNATKTKWYVI